MANIRELKKKIDAQIYALVSDCFTFSTLHPEEKPDEVSKIISEACSLWQVLIHKVNNPPVPGDKGSKKAHYSMINNDLSDGVNDLCVRLSSLSKKRKK